ncbi:BZ3500_MvSof-1268-A1-R1_C094g00511 [Microbotryum saponariae]|uniref:BZ3500_MvSof-1268-A1-R1_C077g00410 protein n=1 Tax=Microbotryum saponariae TaxID=289078 RepID=A0A2X0KNQ3_9BASI|nr:BZ3500_MvSof-1268-A1-R1_C077g00410 [Microbotryum saponariae]SCZ93993.1 BZ3500_MvSof-1268-A1-R1_Chr6-1g08353 [Microbotryum saponariae]SCZ98167.1 BZ3500_MvSof-1268-A1-R1_Chr3-3g06630 [Microbotryum saponariae]SCZ98489.1 BZ3500_MvSof-1268-A1-R1_Chr3-1g05417 [Microbotryum saponariae]SDA04040.1 BZ3500_MvSof-1268-A1-R1_C094g00511 [Microbotryum saponariae]
MGISFRIPSRFSALGLAGLLGVSPSSVEQPDFISARAISPALRFGDFDPGSPSILEQPDFSSARAIPPALPLFIFTGDLGF